MKTKEEVLSILKTHPNGNIEEPQFKKKFLEHYQILSTWNFPSDFRSPESQMDATSKSDMKAHHSVSRP